MRICAIVLAASLGLPLTGVAFAQGVPGGGGSGGNFQSQPDASLSGRGGPAFGGPKTTGFVGRSTSEDLGDADDDEDGDDATVAAQDRGAFGNSGGRALRQG